MPVRIRINYGTGDIHSGQVMILPYGKNAPELQIGDTVAGMEIVDISYDNNNLFYYIKSTVSTTVDTPTDDQKRYRFVRIPQDSQLPSDDSMPFDYVFCQDQVPDMGANWCLWYDTSTNYLRFKTNKVTTYDHICTIPYAVTEGKLVREVFNGIGFIGSIIWIDKGVTCAFTNGLKDDGTINNLIQTNEYFTIQDIDVGTYTSTTVRWLFLYSGFNVQDIYSYETNSYLPNTPIVSGSSNVTFCMSDNNFYRWDSAQQNYAMRNALYLGKISHEPSGNINAWDIITTSTNYMNNSVSSLNSIGRKAIVDLLTVDYTRVTSLSGNPSTMPFDGMYAFAAKASGGAGGQVLINGVRAISTKFTDTGTYGWSGFASSGDKIQVTADGLNSLSMWAFPFKGAY